MDHIGLRNEGKSLGLDLCQGYLNAPYEVLVDVCNGVGPAWLPDWVLELITDYFEYFLPSTNQHDYGFEFDEKTKFEFDKENERLYANMKLQVKKDNSLSWWHLCKKTSKWRKNAQARFLYEMCVRYGGSAFFTEED
jgi:hypothetical protein